MRKTFPLLNFIFSLYLYFLNIRTSRLDATAFGKMTELLRDTVFGKIVRFASRGKLFQWAEERDPELWKK